MQINSVNTYSKIAFNGVLDNSLHSLSEDCIKDRGVSSYTYLFRGPLDWEVFSKYLVKTFPKGTNVYNFACSTGLEIYSLKIMMDKELKKQKNDAVFNYYAYDVDKDTVEEANSRQVYFDFDDKTSYGLYNKEPLQKYFEQLSGDVYKVKKDSLLNDIKFEYGDITKWARQKQDKPCIVMFRNAWPYLKKSYQTELLKDLYNNLQSGSILVLGEYDLTDNYFAQKIIESKFEPLKEADAIRYRNHFVYKKP